MEKILKFEVDVDAKFGIDLPLESKVLTVRVQDGIPYIWVIGDPTFKSFKRRFRILRSEQEVPEDESLQYVGSFELDDRPGTFHLFEIKGAGIY